MAPDVLKDWAPQAYGIWTLVLMAVVYFAREYRETRKLSSEDRQARREGYTRDVENLRIENRSLRGELRDLNADYGDYRRAHQAEFDEYRRLCRDENEQRLQEVRLLEDKVRGLERKIDAQSAAIPRVIDAKLKENGGGDR